MQRRAVLSCLGMASVVVVAPMLISTTGCISPAPAASKAAPATLIFADISESVSTGRLDAYRQTIYSAVDACAQSGEIEILTFTNQITPTGLSRVYEGKPEDADSVLDLVRKKIYPDHRVPASDKATQGTTFEGILTFTREECRRRPVRVLIASDGQLCGANERSDDEVINGSRRCANALADESNFRGLAVVPVADGKTNQILHEVVFKQLADRKPAFIIPIENASDAIQQFANLR